MAVISPTIVSKTKSVTITWAGITEADTTDPVNLLALGVPMRLASAHITGNFGTGGMVDLRGSNTGANFSVLDDATGTAIALMAAGIVDVVSGAGYARVVISAGTGVSVTVTLTIWR